MTFGIFTARKRSLRRLCFHRCFLSVHGRGGGGGVGLHPDRGGKKAPSDIMGYSHQAGTHPAGIHSC